MSSQTATGNLSSVNHDGGSRALIIGLVGIAIALVGVFIGIIGGDSRPVLSLLMGFAFWMAVLVGMLFLIQIWYLFDAGWSVIVRRQMEHVIGGFPILFLVLLPLVVFPMFLGDNTGLVWKWMNPLQDYPGGHQIGHDPLYLDKKAFLNLPFFYIRLGLYFIILCGLAHSFRKWSFNNDTNPSVGNVSKCRKLSAVGLFVTALTVTFAAFDLYMSLSYHWFSTMYGVWFFALSMRAALAVTILLCLYLSVKGRALDGIFRQPHYYLLGCLCLAFTVFWAYISFSQYFLIYNANIPEETFWYSIREIHENGDKNQWFWVSMSLIFGFFLFPFIYLLFYKNKVTIDRLKFICYWILAFVFIDLSFNLLPTQKADPDKILGYKVTPFLSPYILFDIAAVAGVGGLVLWAAARSRAKTEPIPIHDPRISESINYQE